MCYNADSSKRLSKFTITEVGDVEKEDRKGRLRSEGERR